MLKNKNQSVEEVKTQVFLAFRLANEIFAASVNCVVNILEMVQITPVPLSPNYMKGVLNQRGSVLPVVDTRIKLGLPISEHTKDTCIIVLTVRVDDETVEVGAIADAVSEVIEVPETDMLPAIQLGSMFDAKFVKGMIKHNDQFIMVLNVDHLFEIEKLDGSSFETE